MKTGECVLVHCALVGLFVLAAGCSKKDVRTDEPLISAENTGGSADLPETQGAVAAEALPESAGDVAPVVNALQNIYFPFDSDILTVTARQALAANADWIKQNPKIQVQIEGHCDDRGTTEYNLALGERRANATRAYLIKLGVEANRISTISYGEERPIETGFGEQVWAKNRRATFATL